MAETPQDQSLLTAPAGDAPTVAGDELVEESLVEEVSIDGMCGVY